MRYCKNCGLLLPFDAAQCPECGAPVPPPAQPAAAPDGPRYEAAPAAPAKPSRAEEAFCPLSLPATIGYLLLFAIPVVGFILTLVWSLGGTRRPALRQLAQAYLGRTLILSVLISALLVLAALGLAGALQTAVFYSYSQPYYFG